jgi:hypothetical protein
MVLVGEPLTNALPILRPHADHHQAEPKKETVITIKGKVFAHAVHYATRYLPYLQLTGVLKSGTQAQVEELARSVKRGKATYTS